MRTVQLGDVASINPGGELVGADEEVSFVGMAQLNAERACAIPLETREFAEVSKGYTVFRDQDVLAAKITPCWENGKVGEARLAHRIGVGSTEFHVLRPGDDLDRRYLLRFLRQPSIRVTGEVRMTGSGGQRRVPTAYLSELQIPLPPLEEQRRIAAILDHADALRAKRRQVLAHLDTLTQSIFHDMFGAPLSNDRDVPRQAIGSIAEIVTGGSPSRADATNFGDSIEWIKSDNLAGHVASTATEWLSIRAQKRARIAPAGSILVTCIAGSPASIGKASLVDRAVSFNQQINAIIPGKSLLADFLLGQLKVAPELVRAKSTGGMKGLVSKSSFQAIEVLVPPIELQREFATVAREVDAQRNRVQRALAADDELFASLQARAFRGEL